MNASVLQISQKLAPVFEKYRDAILFGYCFGSHATGETIAKSDIDLAVYLNPQNLDFDFKLSLRADTCRQLNRDDVDLIVLNTLKNLIVAAEIVWNGVLIYENAPEIREDYELKSIHRAIDFRTQRKAIMGI
jgi:predicted nucleotidyltransferase